MIHFNFYRPESNFYMRLVHVASGKVWDDFLDILSDDPEIIWVNSAIVLSYSSVIGGYPITLPNRLPQGDYDVLFYESATPQESDEVVTGKKMKWSGNNLSYAVAQLLDM